MADKLSGIGAVGERDAVIAFRAVGMRVIPAETASAVARAVHALVSENVPVIFITEHAAEIAPETFEKYQSDPTVSLIPIPGSSGTDGFGMRRVHQNVEKAIGANILLTDEQ